MKISKGKPDIFQQWLIRSIANAEEMADMDKVGRKFWLGHLSAFSQCADIYDEMKEAKDLEKEPQTKAEEL